MNLSSVWDWTFFWNTFGFILKTVASFLMIIVAIIAVGMLLQVVIRAVRSNRDS
jgi:ascorbate-specific PTS system EIIC-type component UlaA